MSPEPLTGWSRVLSAQDEGEVSAPGVVERLLDEAAVSGASDLHLDPGADRVTIRLRIDGVLHPAGEFTGPLAGRIIARLKVLANLLSYRHDIPQEGRIEASGDRPEMRLAVFPTIGGERAVVRLFQAGGRVEQLNQLGLAPDQAEMLARLAGAADGMVLLTGPAGSGKTTTIYALLRHIVDTWPGRSVLTLEDPVEQVVAGVSQSQVGGPGGLGFAEAIRSALRQDPQVLVVGEIRDGVTAATAVQAALSGHLLISTIHAGSAPAVFARLLQIGVEPFQVASSVTAVLNQRLPRRLCGQCAGAGCLACRRTGYQGRLLVAELLLVGEATRRTVMARAALDELERAAGQDGLIPLRQVSGKLVEEGLTTDEELSRVGAH